MSVEQRKEECPDVCAVDVSISGNNYLVIAQFRDIEDVTYCSTHCDDEVLYLLDTLVENGSSAAFRMRDDFVTPVSVG